MLDYSGSSVRIQLLRCNFRCAEIFAPEKVSVLLLRKEGSSEPCIGNMINLMSDDDSKVEEIISSPEKQSPPHSKKRQPFSPLNGRDLRKARTNDVNKEKKDPRSLMRSLLHNKEDCISTYLFSTYKKKTVSFPGTPPCHSTTPIVTDLAIGQRILENQVGRAFDATDDIGHLLSRFMRNFIFIQGEPNKNAESGENHTPHDQSWSRSSCQLHIDSRFLFCSDLGPSPYNHPIAYNTEENRKLLADILSFVGNLTIKLGREKESAFRIHCIRYTVMAWGNMQTILASDWQSVADIVCDSALVLVNLE